MRASTKRSGALVPRAAYEGAERYVPESRNLAQLSRAIQKCRGCDLYRDATHAVFGEGSTRARLVLVGEQPEDQEDRQGRPFVGPAGALLDRALAEADTARRDVFVTNAVKHFGEVQACRPWLFKELDVVRSDVLVCLGATASKAVLGPAFRLLKQRGEFVESDCAQKVLATDHPSAALRADDDAGRDRIYGLLVRDLRKATSAMRA